MNKSKQGVFECTLFTESNRSKKQREGEVRLSEHIKFGLKCAEVKYVILGISEDIGPQMNGGFSGSNLGFSSFLNALQNVQHNQFSTNASIGVLGEIEQIKSFNSKAQAQGWVEDLDDFIQTILEEHLSKDQILIVIGGGHNNAFPILRHIQKVNGNRVQSANIDPHADCRTTEYRHSGNPFSMAIENRLIESYSVFGLHESYNNQYIYDFLKTNDCLFQSFEEFLDDESNWWNTYNQYWSNLNDSLPTVLDLDLDSIAFCPTSALTPSGFSIDEIRKMIRIAAKTTNIQAFHLPEGAPKTENELRLYGKMISYFVLDFIKCQYAR